ncbi:hypothetical protein DXG01_009135 [Tephrocybe rancida]|nr:hypothetical protein DXG01_009135 [Tephrocybe rancida]
MPSSAILTLPQVSYGVQERLDLLQNVSEALHVEDPSDFSSCSSAISQLSEESLSAQRLLNRLQCIQFELQSHLASLRYEQRLVDKWDATLDTQHKDEESAAMIGRRKEDLTRKAKEYHEELKAVLKTMPEAPRITVSRLKEQETRNKAKEQELKAKRAKIKAFKGLPPNLDLARHDLRQARHELEKLTHLRERLLGRMAESTTYEVRTVVYHLSGLAQRVSQPQLEDQKGRSYPNFSPGTSDLTEEFTRITDLLAYRAILRELKPVKKATVNTANDENTFKLNAREED